MDYFQGVKTCTTNLENYLPDSYKEITHNTVAEMLMDDNYLHEIHTIQISTCKRYLSICFDTRETMLQFVDTDHLLKDVPITFEPDYYEKIRISIENLPIELPDSVVKEFLSTYNILPRNQTYQQTFYNRNKNIQVYQN